MAGAGPGRAAAIVRLGALAGTLIALAIAVSAAPATAATFVHSTSKKVALIPQNGPVPPQPSSGGLPPNGVMPISSFVTGRANESFDQFSFTDVPLSQITPANLAHYDTVALIQVKTRALSTAQKAALAGFVANGGKLLIHDSDETSGNDYSWLLPGGYTTKVGQGCTNCGSTGGTSTILADSSLISANPADPSYVDLAALHTFTDAIGDSNLLVSTDPAWAALVEGTNVQNGSGAQVAYASSNNGLVVYNGFDTDLIKTLASDRFRCNDVQDGYKCPPPPAAQPTVDYLAQMWYSELAQGWGTPGQSGGGGGGGGGLPKPKPVLDIGVPFGASSAGLPSNRLCVAHRSMLLRLGRLAHLRGRKIVQADVYVNLKHVLRERIRSPRNALHDFEALRHLELRQARGAVGAQLLRRSRPAVPQDHLSDDRLPPLRRQAAALRARLIEVGACASAKADPRHSVRVGNAARYYCSLGLRITSSAHIDDVVAP